MPNSGKMNVGTSPSLTIERNGDLILHPSVHDYLQGLDRKSMVLI